MSYTLIERKELTEAASSISFENIPQFYSDLMILTSLRSSATSGASPATIRFNGSTSGFTSRRLLGSGSATSSNTFTNGAFSGYQLDTANTFDSTACYVVNYASSTNNKAFSSEHVTEANQTTAYQAIFAGVWANNNAITSLSVHPDGAENWVAGTSVSLYGINRQQAIGAPKALGGQISFANGHWVHTFTGSGTFVPQENMTVDALVIAGGGGGGSNKGGGGGAGGYLEAYGRTLQKSTNYPVVIGSGGATGTTFIDPGFNGNVSSFLTIAPLGGGGGASDQTNSPVNGQPGGSGGGGARGGSGGAGTSGQGNAGGSGERYNAPYGGGGGGGAGAVGQSTTGNGGNGGNGLSSTITGTAVFRAGGGGGSYYTPLSGTAGTGGLGGGGNGGTMTTPPTTGTANTGGGGGAWNADHGYGASGGSGVVIIRYKA